MIYRRGSIWHSDFMVAGQRVRCSTKQKTKAAAAQVEAKLMARAMETGIVTPRRAPRLIDFGPRFFGWVEEAVKSGRRKATTQRYYENGWGRIKDSQLATMAMDRIDAHAVETLRLPGSGPWVNQAIRTLRRMLGKAEEWHVISKAPRIPLVKEYARDGVIDADAERALLSNGSPLLCDALMFSQDCGLRREEIASSRVEYIDWQTRSHLVPDGKTRNARRRVPLGHRVFDMLFVRAGAKKEGWLFEARSGEGHVSADALSRAFARARDKANLPKSLVFHSARHTFGTEVYTATGNLKAVMASMGHGDVRTAMKYQHPELDVVRDAIDRRNERHNPRHSERPIA